jgi:nucleoid-associated protein YgaU
MHARFGPKGVQQMPRLLHGTIQTPRSFQETMQVPPTGPSPESAPHGQAPRYAPTDAQRFGYLFPALQADDANLLPTDPATTEALKVLGRAMEDDEAPPGNSAVPAIYTYFGQFVDHDVTLEGNPEGLPPDQATSPEVLLDPDMTPLTAAQVVASLINLRTAALDLDSLYGDPAPRDPADPAKMLIGQVTDIGRFPERAGPDNDLPREPRSADITHDRAALIGDPRNDENLIVAQLHLAFLKAHNALVDDGISDADAQRVLRHHYQYVVIHDFLKRVADPDTVDRVLYEGNTWYDLNYGGFYIPLEFSVAAYRFGHSMVRDVYEFNVNFNSSGAGTQGLGTLGQLFTFTALSGQIGGAGPFPGFDTLPSNWIIEWDRFVDGAALENPARKIDTNLADPGLFTLRNLVGQPEAPPDKARLSVRNLLRGYRYRLPTGQAVANLLGVDVLTPDQLRAAAGSQTKVDALDAGGFAERTPLWYYILAEAAQNGGDRMGPVGSTIVTEVLVGLIRHTTDSVLRYPGWTPSLPAAGDDFELADLLRLGGTLEGGMAPTTYTVQEGDNLFGIAHSELGDGNRWPEIFLGNRSTIANRNLITVGQVLVLPTEPADPRWGLHEVRAGDALSGIARSELGDGNRWPEIHDLNRDIVADPDRIVPGQLLILPGE